MAEPDKPSVPVDMRALSVFCVGKAGMDSVDQARVNSIVYENTKDSEFFKRQQERGKQVNDKIQRMLQQKAVLDLQASQQPYLHQARLARAHRKLQELESRRDTTATWICVDMDSFYASVELLDRPDLKEKPVAIGGFSMICTANYVARRFGVRAAMPGHLARKLCPELIFLPLNFNKYKHYSQITREIFSDYDKQFESFSLDEAAMEISAFLKENPGKSPESIAKEIRQRIFENTGGLTASAGIAGNRMLAKICTEIEKPNGQFRLENSPLAVQQFLATLNIRKIPGIGKTMENILNSLGITKCGDFHHLENVSLIMELFSPITGNWILSAGLGISRSSHDSPEEMKRKSISCERTFGELSKYQELEEKVRELAEILGEEIRKAGEPSENSPQAGFSSRRPASSISGRCLTLKFKSVNFSVQQRSATVERFLSGSEEFFKVAMNLLREELEKLKAGAVAKGIKNPPGAHPLDGLLKLRLLGLRLSSLRDDSPDCSDLPKGISSIKKFAVPVDQLSNKITEKKETTKTRSEPLSEAALIQFFGLSSSSPLKNLPPPPRTFPSAVVESFDEEDQQFLEESEENSEQEFFQDAPTQKANPSENISISSSQSVNKLSRPRSPSSFFVPPAPPSSSSESGEPVFCPVCSENLGLKVSNLALNRHLDGCLGVPPASVDPPKRKPLLPTGPGKRQKLANGKNVSQLANFPTIDTLFNSVNKKTSR